MLTVVSLCVVVISIYKHFYFSIKMSLLTFFLFSTFFILKKVEQ